MGNLGGVGIEWGESIYDVPWLQLGSFGFASKAIITQGLYGGYGIPAMPFVWISDTNLKEMMGSSDSRFPFSNRMALERKGLKGLFEPDKFPSPFRLKKEGDIMIGGFGGGGGYGDPIERDPKLIMKDLEEGVISHRVAKEIYKVFYDEKNLIVDEEKTRLLREQERMKRKQRGKRFQAFEKEWLQKKPDDEILEFYGPWLEGRYTSFSYYGHWIEKPEEDSQDLTQSGN